MAALSPGDRPASGLKNAGAIAQENRSLGLVLGMRYSSHLDISDSFFSVGAGGREYADGMSAAHRGNRLESESRDSQSIDPASSRKPAGREHRSVSGGSKTLNDLSVSVVVPTYQEVQNLQPLVGRIGRAMSKPKRPYEIIVVDDNSRDGTERVVKELREFGHPIRLITRIGERGLSSAVIRGFSEANGEALVCLDADLSHPPEAIPMMLERFGETDVDFVVASRYVRGGSTDEDWGPLRWINSKVATALARPLSSVKDPMSGFFSIPKRVYEKAAPLNPIGYKIALELIVKCNCSNIREVPIHFAQRQFGESKLSLAERLNYLRHLSRLLRFKFKYARRNGISKPEFSDYLDEKRHSHSRN